MKGPMRRRIEAPFTALLLALLLVVVASTIPTRSACAGGVPLPGEPNPESPPSPGEGDPDVPTGSGRSQPQGGARPTPVTRPQWGAHGAAMPSPNDPRTGYVLLMRTALSVWFRLHLPY